MRHKYVEVGNLMDNKTVQTENLGHLTDPETIEIENLRVWPIRFEQLRSPSDLRFELFRV